MWRVVTSTCIALTFFASVAAAQQPCTTDTNRVVSELYRHILQRPVDPGAKHWEQQLASGAMTVREVVRNLVTSQEHLQRFGQTEAGEGTPYERAVARMYRHILGRQPDPEGQRVHAQLWQQSGPQAVVDAILNSEEYRNQFGDWEVPGSGGVTFCAPANSTAGKVAVQPQVAANVGVTEPRFRGLDRNNDGVITRNEWRGNNRSFQVQDWNGDGVLSGEEVRAGGRRDGVRGRNEAIGTAGDLVIVDSSVRWTDTGIDVREGQRLVFDARGQVRLSDNPGDFADAGGSTSGRRAANAPVRNAPAGGLLARIGDSQPVYVGDRRALRAPVSGRLFLGVNVDHLADNEGQYQVTIDVR